MPTSIPAHAIYARKSASLDRETDQFVAVAIFSGIGLLLSIVAVLLGAQGVWF